MTFGKLVIARAKKDPVFRKQVLMTLRKHLASLQRAIQALEDLK